MAEDWHISCSVCGKEVEIFDICKRSGWHNSGRKEGDDDPPGPNKMTLRQAKEAFKRVNKSASTHYRTRGARTSPSSNMKASTVKIPLLDLLESYEGS